MNFHVIAFLISYRLMILQPQIFLMWFTPANLLPDELMTFVAQDKVIFGYAIDGTEIEVVCRFINNKVFFITVYEDE